MSNNTSSLDAAASDRKARLAKLASLKRKQPGSDTTISEPQNVSEHTQVQNSQTDSYISGRNFDTTTRAPKLGFENIPQSQQETIEQQAERVSQLVAEQNAKDETDADKGIDLFKLQPKKPNWDLKRDLAEKMKPVDVRTQNAIARLVRERIAKTKEEALRKGKSSSLEDEGEELGVEGNTLVEAVHQREREEQEEMQRTGDLEEDDSVS